MWQITQLMIFQDIFLRRFRDIFSWYVSRHFSRHFLKNFSIRFKAFSLDSFWRHSHDNSWVILGTFLRHFWKHWQGIQDISQYIIKKFSIPRVIYVFLTFLDSSRHLRFSRQSLETFSRYYQLILKKISQGIDVCREIFSSHSWDMTWRHFFTSKQSQVIFQGIIKTFSLDCFPWHFLNLKTPRVILGTFLRLSSKQSQGISRHFLRHLFFSGPRRS